MIKKWFESIIESICFCFGMLVDMYRESKEWNDKRG